MENKEKFKNVIIDIFCEGDSVAVNKDTYVPVACNDISCEDCLFFNAKRCQTSMFNTWVHEEYKEPVVISFDDFNFLSYIKDKYAYIARDKNDRLYVYVNEPIKLDSVSVWCGKVAVCIDNFNVVFPMVKWSDDHSWKISVLKKLKIVENY